MGVTNGDGVSGFLIHEKATNPVPVGHPRWSFFVESRRELCYYNTEYLYDFIRRSNIVYAISKKAGQFHKGKNKR
jgi:hypothetical protein